MAFMLIEFGAIRTFGQTIEVTEQIQRASLWIRRFATFFRLATQIVDQYLGLDFFLDV
ncbi:hypothetical protein [Pseudomonas amygdali]|uniref:hypothetical protein n=1 Tax=Pseudomonas amygdali TaxID=47877 RepID=UPI0001CC2711|nr:hypothetical protein [Pseudomonas amygdali]WGQ03870.1 hypothetical protein QFG70_29430 [Pseudomonas amygdali pv. aesculi]